MGSVSRLVSGCGSVVEFKALGLRGVWWVGGREWALPLGDSAVLTSRRWNVALFGGVLRRPSVGSDFSTGYRLWVGRRIRDSRWEVWWVGSSSLCGDLPVFVEMLLFWGHISISVLGFCYLYRSEVVWVGVRNRDLGWEVQWVKSESVLGNSAVFRRGDTPFRIKSAVDSFVAVDFCGFLKRQVFE